MDDLMGCLLHLLLFFPKIIIFWWQAARLIGSIFTSTTIMNHLMPRRDLRAFGYPKRRWKVMNGIFWFGDRLADFWAKLNWAHDNLKCIPIQTQILRFEILFHAFAWVDFFLGFVHVLLDSIGGVEILDSQKLCVLFVFEPKKRHWQCGRTCWEWGEFGSCSIGFLWWVQWCP